MKTAHEIAKTINTTYYNVSKAIKRLNLSPCYEKSNIKYYNEFKQKQIYDDLHNLDLIPFGTDRTISEMAKICDISYDDVASIIAKENIIPYKSNPYRLNNDQQMIVFMVLHYESRCNYITLPSKLNDPNFDAPEVYSRENFISAGLIIKK